MENRKSTRPECLDNIKSSDAGALFYNELIELPHGKQIIIDDCSDDLLDLKPNLADLTTQLPNIEVLSLSDLNAELYELLKQLNINPDTTLYVLPGGGGRRLALSFMGLGMDMPNNVEISVERPILQDGSKGDACISEKSIQALEPYLLHGYETVVTLDDAINRGGTLRAIRDVFVDSPYAQLRQPVFHAATPVRFSIPNQNE